VRAGQHTGVLANQNKVCYEAANLWGTETAELPNPGQPTAWLRAGNGVSQLASLAGGGIRELRMIMDRQEDE